MRKDVSTRMLQDFSKAELSVDLLVAYAGVAFTVAHASVSKTNGNGKLVNILAEGVSRCSHLDKRSTERGNEIAMGRALKALHQKVFGGKNPRHHYMA